MGNLFNTALRDPLAALLRVLYESVTFGDLGVAIVILTVLIRTALAPLFYKSLRQQAALRKLQPHIKTIQDRHKNDREAQGKALMDLYREHGVNPLTSFGLLLIQLPILIALYQVFLSPLPGIDQSFLGLINLQERSTLMVVIAALLQYFLGILSIDKNAPADDPGARMGRNMAVIGPLITVLVLYSLPAAVALYWIATTAFSIAQQMHVSARYGKNTGNN